MGVSIPETARHALAHPGITGKDTFKSVVTKKHTGELLRVTALASATVFSFVALNDAQNDQNETSDRIHALPLYAQDGVDTPLQNMTNAINALYIYYPTIDNTNKKVMPVYPNTARARGELTQGAEYFPEDTKLHVEILSVRDTLPPPVAEVVAIDGVRVTNETFKTNQGQIDQLTKEIQALEESPERKLGQKLDHKKKVLLALVLSLSVSSFVGLKMTLENAKRRWHESEGRVEEASLRRKALSADYV